jgi:signal peptidase I
VTTSTRPGRARWIALLGSGGLFALAALVLLVGTIAFPRFTIASEKMSPSLTIDATVWAMRTDGSTVGRGDMIVFRRPDRPLTLVSRVVAIGGDTVESRGCHLLVNGAPVEEPYVAPGVCTERVSRTAVPEGSVYELGDNRTNSKDSRFDGPVANGLVSGKVVLSSGPSTAVLLIAVAVAGLVFLMCFAAWRGPGGGRGIDPPPS